MITKVKPDRQKSASLKRMAAITLQRLEKTEKAAYPSNTLTDYYDAIHKLLEALTLQEGIKINGEGAHRELIEYVAQQKLIDEQTRQFLQQMREWRNRISYEGFMVHGNYVELNEKKIQEIVNHLQGLLQ